MIPPAASRRRPTRRRAWLPAIVAIAAVAAPRALAQEPRAPRAARVAGPTATILAAQDAEAPGGPRLQLDPPALDLGEVYYGGSVGGRVTLRNVGDAPLRIEAIDTTCGCTVAELPPAARTLAPGASVELPVTMTPKSGLSPLAKSVRITTNDPRTPLTLLRVSTIVRLGVHAEPGYVLFDDAEPGAALERVLAVSAGDGTPFRIETITFEGEGLYAARWDPEREALAHEVVVSVARVPDRVPATARMVVASTHPRTPRTLIDVNLHLATRIEASDDALAFGALGPGGTATLPLVVVERRTGAPVTGVRLEQTRYPGVVLEARPDAGDARLWHVTLRVPDRYAGQHLVAGARLITDLEDPEPTVLVVSASCAADG